MEKKRFLKKSYLWMLAACIGLQMTSCSEENIPAGGNESNMITFTVTPDYGVKTRTAVNALPEGADALRYIMEVYDGTTLVTNSRQIESTTSPGTPVQFSLAKNPGKAYTVVFWADYTATDKADVYFDTTTGGLKDISIKKVLDGTEKCQAFSSTVAIDNKGEVARSKISLTRAVAQVNLKTTNKLTGYKSVKVSYGEAEANAPASHFNALDGTTATNAVIPDITNTVDPTQTATEAAPYIYHTYYVFAPKATQGVINVVVDLCSDDAGATPVKNIKISSVPLQANYKTNITGNLGMADLTFEVSCENEWATPDNVAYVFVGEGTEVTPYLIQTVTDLKMLAKNINEGINDYDDQYFNLEANLDLNNEIWTPIAHGYYGVGAKGIHFNGKGHRITGLNVDDTNLSSKYINAGFFGQCRSVKNLHVEGNVTSTNTGGYYAGGIAGVIETSENISNCSFTGTVSGYCNVGGLVGEIRGYTTLEGCKNSATITLIDQMPSSYVGGLVGLANGLAVNNCYNTGNITATNGGSSNGSGVGGLIGKDNSGGDAPAGYQYCYNTDSITGFSNNYTTSKTIGSMVGIMNGLDEQNKDSKFTECFATALYAYEGTTTKVFSQTDWPAWSTVAVGLENIGWKSLGEWKADTPVYPALAWE